MSAFVPDFDYDVFVSYAHVDNVVLASDDKQSGWVDTIKDDLRKLLAQKLGRAEWGKIWMDHYLRGDEPFPDEVRDAVRRSATLLVVLSEGYLQSNWCRQERELFLEANAHRGDVNKRIFVVQHTEINHQQWPEEFRNRLGYKLFKKDREDGPPRTLGMFGPKEQLYFERLDDLSRELKERLEWLRSKPAPAAQPHAPDADNAIFLAEVTPDLEELRDNVRRHLEQVGLRVLPKTYYERAPSAYQAAMEQDLSQCVLFVQLLGRYTTLKTPDLPKGYEGLQLDLAKATKIPILGWHSPELDIDTVKDRELLTREEVMVMAFEDFKREVEKKARQLAARRNRPEINGAVYVLVDVNSRDQPVLNDVIEILDHHGINYDTIDENEKIPLSEYAQEEDFNALMVVYGQCEQTWAKDQVRQCRRLVLKRKTNPPLCAIYDAPVDPKLPLGIKPPGFLFFNDLSEPVFNDFIETVRARVEDR